MTEIIVRADPDLDDCLQGAVDAYVAAHPDARRWDLSPRWADETRENVALTVPSPPNAVEDCDALYDDC